MIYLTVYQVTREYGGPEEGGWWYDAGEPIESIELEEDEELQQVSIGAINYAIERFKKDYGESGPKLHQVGGIELRFSIGNKPGKLWPARRPHYE